MKVSKNQIKDALSKTGGFKTQAAKMLGISYQALWKRIKADKELEMFDEELQEQFLDMAESKLLQQVREGNLGAICFFLKCKGKHRGYIEKQQIDTTFENKEPLIIIKNGGK